MKKIICKACGRPLSEHSWQYLDLICAKKLDKLAKQGGK